MIQYHVFLPGRANPPSSTAAAAALLRVVERESDASYARMIAYRLAGAAADECEDCYFIATEGDRCVSRLWYGWGRHADAIGNFGNFRTADELQGQGIGGRLMAMLAESLRGRNDPPLALFCTSSKPHLVRMYAKLGFRPALTGTEKGPLYSPLAGSPETFPEFCRAYYRPARELRLLAGTVGWRHEVDCLLNFALREAGENPVGGPGGYSSFEAAFLALAGDPSLGKLERLVTDAERTVGWAFTPRGGRRELLVHPDFRDLPIREEA